MVHAAHTDTITQGRDRRFTSGNLILGDNHLQARVMATSAADRTIAGGRTLDRRLTEDRIYDRVG